ncbi:glycerol-3-phosphate 1-O-acyltransferase PlsY [Acidobacteria bacterium ACD]|nr:MAG: glycerol-3-phosphate 1-O-acyltransferase [Acidobacteriota bacterium]MCE7959360.1 glycerol-3-phosphate 1-O-acyltransferase [Acidobacteria bacterium ACB2]MDL1951520.1 glycerol-3-phosphate 1-O-acyltransferase PlsY [Acidobacteria bacterium ACD]
MSWYLVEVVLASVAAYLLGSLSFATILVKLFLGIDVRDHGSGNAGATNVLRTAGRRLAVFTLLLDVLKGSLAVLGMRLLTPDPTWHATAAAAVIFGHVFPVFFGFRGGKGVATAVGAFLCLSPLAVLVVGAVFGLVVWLTRLVSLGSLTAACLLPVVMGLLFRAPDADVLAAVANAAFLVFSHRANVKRLLDGTERRLGQKEPPEE